MKVFHVGTARRRGPLPSKLSIPVTCLVPVNDQATVDHFKQALVELKLLGYMSQSESDPVSRRRRDTGLLNA